MTGPSALDAAVAELYSHPMAEFTTRRKTLAAAARKAGDRESADAIAILRKPTRSADTLNQLVRSAPDEVGELLRLGSELREAEKALDAHQLRELTGRRRRLVRDLTDLAFDVTGQATPSTSVRDEVAGTLNAALADDHVAERLLTGVLLTQAHWDGFGSTALPELAAVISLDTLRQARRARPKPTTDREPSTPPLPRTGSRPEPTVGVRAAGSPEQVSDSGPSREIEKEATSTNAADADARAAADRAQRLEAAAQRAAADRAQRLEAAAQEATDADAQALAADEAVRAIEGRISDLGRRLTAEREHLVELQSKARSAQIRRRAARLALTRAGGNRA